MLGCESSSRAVWSPKSRVDVSMDGLHLVINGRSPGQCPQGASYTYHAHINIYIYMHVYIYIYIYVKKIYIYI